MLWNPLNFMLVLVAGPFVLIGLQSVLAFLIQQIIFLFVLTTTGFLILMKFIIDKLIDKNKIIVDQELNKILKEMNNSIKVGKKMLKGEANHYENK